MINGGKLRLEKHCEIADLSQATHSLRYYDLHLCVYRQQCYKVT